MLKRNILAIRIYFDSNDVTPMADLLMNDGVVEHICWVDVEQRKEFEPFMNGYTLVYDERPKRPWKDWF